MGCGGSKTDERKITVNKNTDKSKDQANKANNDQNSNNNNNTNNKANDLANQGKKLADKTLNARLGILGGISILGTTGMALRKKRGAVTCSPSEST